MKFLVISGNPKKDGLCHSILEEVRKGASDGGGDVEILTVQNLQRCMVCKDGWGSCRDQNTCVFENDGFKDIQQKMKNADAICLITPVYWGEMAEGLKSFLDRFRRCEFGQNGSLSGKPVLLVASPGGSGNGALSCLEQMDRFCRHTGAVIFDYIGVNRWNCDYKRKAAFAAAKAISTGRKAGESFE